MLQLDTSREVGVGVEEHSHSLTNLQDEIGRLRARLGQIQLSVRSHTPLSLLQSEHRSAPLHNYLPGVEDIDSSNSNNNDIRPEEEAAVVLAASAVNTTTRTTTDVNAGDERYPIEEDGIGENNNNGGDSSISLQLLPSIYSWGRADLGK